MSKHSHNEPMHEHDHHPRHHHGGPGPGPGPGRHGGFGRGPRRGPGGPGGRRRMFNHGDLRLVVLALIAERPRHGYEIIKEIEERLAGSYSPSPGVVYPTLTLLEEIGHATVSEDNGKKRYAITPDGSAFLEANRAAVDAALATMDDVRAAHGGGPAPQIVRAAENLRTALRLREGRGPLTTEQIGAIAAALDAAALAIERA